MINIDSTLYRECLPSWPGRPRFPNAALYNSHKPAPRAKRFYKAALTTTLALFGSRLKSAELRFVKAAIKKYVFYIFNQYHLLGTWILVILMSRFFVSK